MDQDTKEEMEKTILEIGIHQAQSFEIAANMVEGMHKLDPLLTIDGIVAQLRGLAAEMKRRLVE